MHVHVCAHFRSRTITLICITLISTAKSEDEEDFRRHAISRRWHLKRLLSWCRHFFLWIFWGWLWTVWFGRWGMSTSFSQMILLTISHKYFIFINRTFTAWEYQLLNGIGDSYKLLVSSIKPSVKRKKCRESWCLPSILFYLGYFHFSF